MTISLQRFEQLLDAYGASPQRWPDHERAAALQLLEHSAHAAHLLQNAQWLDQQLDQLPAPDFVYLNTTLLAVPLPARRKIWTDQLLEWLVPAEARTVAVLWRPAALACVPLIMGLAVGNQLDVFSDVDTTDLYSVDMEETELELISLADYSEILQ
jgi:hypothetical protein